MVLAGRRTLVRVVLLVAVAVAVAVGCGQEPSDDLGFSTARGGTAARWEKLPAPPLSARSERVALWTGEEVLVLGGSLFWCPPSAGCAAPDDAPFRDGAALDLRTKEWRPIADAPVPVRSASTAVVGGHVYLLASTGWDDDRAFLRYDVASGAWEELSLPADESHWYTLVAVGEDKVVAYPTSHEQGWQPDLVYDTKSGTWSEIPPPPLTAAFDRTIVRADRFLYLFDKELIPQPESEHPSLTRAARLELSTQTWERLPTSEILGAGPWLVDDRMFVAPLPGGADGGEVSNWGRTYPYGGMFDLDRNDWLPLPPADQNARSAGAYGTTSALALDTQGLVLDLAARQWRELPTLDEPSSEVRVDRTVMAADRAFVALGGVRVSPARAGPEFFNDAWIWRPPGP